MKRFLQLFACVTLLAGPTTVAGQARGPDDGEEGLAELLRGLEWRSIGPAEMGGRTVDIAAIPGDPSTVYFATASGGLWKTENGALTWRSLFDAGGTLSLGAVALAPSDRNVVYLGTGEHNPRNSTSIGDGVYRSTDAGETWKHMGLADSERISRIRVHPADPDVLWVGAMGHLWGPNEERGVYRSNDGGDSWERVLWVDENTGVADLALDASNPRILFAAMWDFRRRPWHFRSGGPGGGLYRSKDGGDSWQRLTDPALENGLPDGVLGRIGVAIAPSDPKVVYAIIESESEGVLWKSMDGGDRWAIVSRAGQIGGRPFYYSDIRVDPTDENTLYALAGGLHKSIDGGRTWRRIASNIHGDHHALWIDPSDPDRLINGNDGGFHFSPDGGESWEFANTVPLAQFYQIGVDHRTPYTVCGGLQDNDSWCGPSRTLNVAGSLQNYWHEIIGPGDGMYVQFDPTDPDIAYANMQGGDLYRVDLSTGEARSIRPYPPGIGGAGADAHAYRFNWNAPVHISPHDPATVYFGGNVLFRTRDGGESWDEISPDLTRAEPEKLVASGGPITPDNTTAEIHATIYTVAESPLEAGVVWVGTDDGVVQLTRDGGATWTDLTDRIPGLPPESWVSRIEASRHAAGTAYAAFDRHRLDDMRPYVFRTTDYGESWTDITDNLPTPGYVHVVREDPRNPDVVYAGTELGIWVSLQRGGSWVSLRNGLPPVAVRDLLVHPRDNDLVIGTHGRGIWILDDLTPIQELAESAGREAHLFTPRPAVRFEPAIRRFRFDIGDRVFVGENPPMATISYALASDLSAPGDAPDAESAEPPPEGGGEALPHEDGRRVRLFVLDAAGDTVRRLEGPAERGIHRVAWDLRYGDATEPDEDDGFRFPAPQPRVLPGFYSVTLEAEGLERPPPARLEVVLDPRLDVAEEALAAQLEALRGLGDLIRSGEAAVRDLDDVEEQIERWRARLVEAADAPAELADTASALLDATADARRGLVPGEDDLGAGLLQRISGLARQIGRASDRPTEPQREWAGRYADEVASALSAHEDVLVRVRAFGQALTAAGIPHVDPGPVTSP